MKAIKKLKEYSVEELVSQYNLSAKTLGEEMLAKIIKKNILDKTKTNDDFKKVFLITEFGNELNLHCLESFDITNVIDRILGSVTLVLTKQGLRRLNLN